MKKKILVGGPKFFNLSNRVVEELTNMGFEVTDITIDTNYRYKSLRERLTNTYYKVALNSLQYKATLRLKQYETSFEEKINAAEKFDYALLFRPDIYPIDFLKKIKNKTGFFAAYFWDGIKIFPHVKDYLKFFDRFYVFDQEDINESTYPATNFYFSNDKQFSKIVTKKIYFIGAFSLRRYHLLKSIKKTTTQLGWNTEITLFTNKIKKIKKYNSPLINVTNTGIDYTTYINSLNNSGVLLDISQHTHNGLSFRIFEAMAKSKKVITNNAHIKEYDFYTPSNYFIIEQGWENKLEGFLNTPYEPLPAEIEEKYSFQNWIRYILDIHPHQKIVLPAKNKGYDFRTAV